MQLSISRLVFFLSFGLTLPIMAQNSLSLQKALQTAKANNPVLKTVFFNQAIAETDIITAKLRPNPVLNNQTLQLMKSSEFPQNTAWYQGQNRQVWYQITKQIQSPSRIKAKIDFAEKNYNFSQKQYAETERNLLLEVAHKWLDVWMAGRQLQLINVAKNNIDSLYIINKLRFDKQVITQTELFRTEILLNQYRLQIKTNQQHYDNELRNLKFIIGTEEAIAIDTASSFFETIPSTMDSLLQNASTNRTDVQAVKSAIDAADANIALQQSLAKPQPELGLIYNPQNIVPYAGIIATIELPFFSKNKGEIKKSFAIKQQAEQSLNLVKLQLQNEIQTSYNSFTTQQSNIENYKNILTKSDQILKSVKYAYLKGSTTIIDFLEAQRSWLDTQQQYNDAVFQYRKAYVQLLYVAGLINKLAK